MSDKTITTSDPRFSEDLTLIREALIQAGADARELANYNRMVNPDRLVTAALTALERMERKIHGRI